VPLPAIVLAGIFAAATGFAFLLDAMKLTLFRRLQIT